MDLRETPVYVVWIHTYNLESLKYCLRTFDERTDRRAIGYRHLIVDSSVGQQEEVRVWIDSENRERPDLPPIEAYFAERPLGPTSKRNLAWSLIQGRCRYVLELEDDVTICDAGRDWLRTVTNQIAQLESESGPAFLDFGFPFDLPELSCAGTLLSAETRVLLGDYPSELSGDFYNLVEELALFPRYLRRLIETRSLRMFGRAELFLEYDLAARTTNYTPAFHREYARRTVGGLISRSEYTRLLDDLYAEFLDRPEAPHTHRDLPELTSRETVARLLRLRGRQHWGVSVKDYRRYFRCIPLTLSEWNSFRESLNDSPILVHILGQSTMASIEGDLALLYPARQLIEVLRRLRPSALEALLRYARA